MNSETTVEPRAAGVRALAIVGFLALVIAGMWLAIYSARFVPGAMNRIGGAAAALTAIFHPGGSASLSVVPTTTPSFDDGSSTMPFSAATSSGGSSSTPYTPLFPTAASTTPAATPAPTPTPAPKPSYSGNTAPSAGQQTSTTKPIGGTGTATTGAPYGLPDLVAIITTAGYMTTPSTDSFVASPSSTVPYGTRAAVRFVIRNVGTGTAGPWRFSASIPTLGQYLYQSDLQQSLAPGDSIEYILGFDQVMQGTQKITITANWDRTLSESDTNNDTATVSINVPGQ